MTPRLTPKRRAMTSGDVQVRLRAARAFLQAAQLHIGETDSASWQVAGANAVSAGIAASDASCGYVLGYCATGDSHTDALGVLEEATRPDSAPRRHQSELLRHKGDYQYGMAATQQRTAALLVTRRRLGRGNIRRFTPLWLFTHSVR